MRASSFPQGAELTPSGVRYCVWAPARQVAVQIHSQGELRKRIVPLFRDHLGYHHGSDSQGQPGDRYFVRFGSGQALPCPASRWQPDGIDGPSMVIDPGAYHWRDHGWRRPAFRDLVLYEAHVGTFTAQGTFLAMIEKLPHLQALGINALELMPVADFPGERNWGYDGVRLYAPARAYGHPDDLRALVDAAHGLGIAVVLDVVYNHLGPEGNCLAEFAPEYFCTRTRTPWGPAINFSHPEVRAFFRANLVYWMEEFHIDGFRLDATHAIVDRPRSHILASFGEAVHERGGYLIAEDERNESRLISPRKEGGYGLDAVWADDFLHSVEVALVEDSSYRDSFEGSPRELADALQHGWIYRGQLYPRRRRRRGTSADHLPPEDFVIALSNHDQTGNRPMGERLHHLAGPDAYRAASALLCLAPATPLLFMGQEWAAGTPFLYFTDHSEELGRSVEEGRKQELQALCAASPAAVLAEAPPAQALESFERSKLDWAEPSLEDHRGCLELYRALLGLRRSQGAFRPADRTTTRAAALPFGVLAIRAEEGDEQWLILCDLRGGHDGTLAGEPLCTPPPGQQWKVALSSNESRFGGRPGARYQAHLGRIAFAQPELLVLHAE